ncbi:hypothetical protein HW555_006471, partial [Spodoptera exigua]
KTSSQMITAKSTLKTNTPSHSKELPKKSPRQRGDILSCINRTRPTKLNERERRLYNVCRRKLKEIIRLRNKIKNKKADCIQHLAEDENLHKLCNLNIILLQSQLRYCPKKPKGRRYTIDQKIMALRIYKNHLLATDF